MLTAARQPIKAAISNQVGRKSGAGKDRAPTMPSCGKDEPRR
jgi:hypothetical protein